MSASVSVGLSAWRDYTVNGVAASGWNEPVKSDIRGYVTQVGSELDALTAAIAALGPAYAYKGTWNASTNSPALVSSTGTTGFTYVVSVAGSTALDGTSTWNVGDLVAFGGGKWQRIPLGTTYYVNYLTLQRYGSQSADNGSVDNLTALAALKADNSSGVIHLTKGSSGVYYFGGGSAPDFGALTVEADDPSVKIASAAWLGTSTTTLSITRPMQAKYFSASLVPYYDCLDPAASVTAPEMRSYLAHGDFDKTTRTFLDCTTDLEHVKLTWPGGVLSSMTPTATTVSSVSIQAVTSTFSYSRPIVGVLPGDEITVYWSYIGSTVLRSIVIETDGGNYHIFSEDVSASATYYTWSGGSTTTTSMSWPAKDTHQTYQAHIAQVSVRLVTQKSFIILINGVAVTGVTPALGNIKNVGFGAMSTSGNVSAITNGWTLKRNAVGGVLPFTLGVLGDSRSSKRYGDWATYARQNLEYFRGIRCTGVSNLAVAGVDAASQLSTLQTAIAGGWPASVVVIALGTNDIQSQTTIGAVGTANTLINTLNVMFNALAGRTILFVMPFVWYGQAQVIGAGGVSGFGQNAANYALGAAYYAAIERFCISRGVEVLDTRELLSLIYADQVVGYDPKVIDPVLMDNIHQTNKVNEVLGRAIARKLATMLAPEPSLVIDRAALPSEGWANGWTSQTAPNAAMAARNAKGTVSLSGGAAAGTLTAGTVIYNLPTYLRPSAGREIVAIASNGPVRLRIDASGAISIPVAATGATWISLATEYSIDRGA